MLQLKFLYFFFIFVYFVFICARKIDLVSLPIYRKCNRLNNLRLWIKCHPNEPSHEIKYKITNGLSLEEGEKCVKNSIEWGGLRTEPYFLSNGLMKSISNDVVRSLITLHLSLFHDSSVSKYTFDPNLREFTFIFTSKLRSIRILIDKSIDFTFSIFGFMIIWISVAEMSVY